MQAGRPIAYFSQTFGVKAAAECTYHNEALALIEALKKMEALLSGKFSYHKN